MIKSNNFGSVKLLLTFIFLFLWIMACTLSPCGAFGSESVHPIIILSDEEIATFDEDKEVATFDEHDEIATFDEDEETASFDENEEATFGSESAANVSPLLHAEHYQAPLYFPDRQKRYLTSHRWMPTIPFVALVILALATTRLFGRRRPNKNIQSGNRTASEKIIICICVGIFLIITITVGVTNAQISYSIKDAVVSLLGEGRELYQRNIKLTKDIKQILREKLWWEPEGSSIKFYYSKTGEETVEAYAFVLSDILLKCGGRHKYCIKVSSKGKVEGVKILELTCPYSFAVNNEQFLNNLKLLNATNAENEYIDAVSGATISSKLSIMIVRRALLLFELLNGSVND